MAKVKMTMYHWLQYALEHSEPECDDCGSPLELVWLVGENDELFLSYIACKECRKEYKCLVCWWSPKDDDYVESVVESDDGA